MLATITVQSNIICLLLSLILTKQEQLNLKNTKCSNILRPKLVMSQNIYC